MNAKLLSFSTLIVTMLSITSCKTDPLLICDRPFINRPVDKVTRIAFGSCADQNLDQPILNEVVKKQPDLFVYLGDNIYGDTYNMNQLRSTYGQLSCKPEFQNLISNTNILATWDDHDYGHNDSGAEYPHKEESKQIFLQFWGDENNSHRQSHPGIYDAQYYGDSTHRVQFLLLDLRTFRTPLVGSFNQGYSPNYDSLATMMGDEQWQWVKQELMKPAILRVICTSTRFASPADGAESWANFPYDQEKMFQTIRDTHAEGVVFLSGDIHFGELCRRQEPHLYPLYDCTASPLARHANEPWGNPFQIATSPVGYNFGLLDIDWSSSDPELTFRLINVNGEEAMKHAIHLSELRF